MSTDEEDEMTEYSIVYRTTRDERLVAPNAFRGQTMPGQAVQAHSVRAARFDEALAALGSGLRTAVRLAAGSTLAISGLAITGGSFGLFAPIGIPVLAVGLALITAEP